MDSGLSPNTLKNALQFSYPKGEKIIADFLEMTPAQIWPSRYQNKKQSA
nr:MAG TPA: winged helix-turn-helix DNA-binding protein [Caudoviricetes sp.]